MKMGISRCNMWCLLRGTEDPTFLPMNLSVASLETWSVPGDRYCFDITGRNPRILTVTWHGFLLCCSYGRDMLSDSEPFISVFLILWPLRILCCIRPKLFLPWKRENPLLRIKILHAWKKCRKIIKKNFQWSFPRCCVIFYDLLFAVTTSHWEWSLGEIFFSWRSLFLSFHFSLQRKTISTCFVRSTSLCTVTTHWSDFGTFQSLEWHNQQNWVTRFQIWERLYRLYIIIVTSGYWQQVSVSTILGEKQTL